MLATMIHQILETWHPYQMLMFPTLNKFNSKSILELNT